MSSGHKKETMLEVNKQYKKNPIPHKWHNYWLSATLLRDHSFIVDFAKIFKDNFLQNTSGK